MARKARETGLCMTCGNEIEDKINDKGVPFANCVRCRPSKKARVNERDVQNPRRDKPRDPDFDLFGTKFWKQFERDVEAMVPRTRALSIRVIKARFRDRYEPDFLNRYVGIALGNLESVGRIRAEWGVPTRYTKAQPVVYSVVQGMAIRQPRREVQPDNASIYQEAR